MQGANQYAPDPPRAAYATLKPGYAWVDAQRSLMVLVNKVADCDSQVRVNKTVSWACTGVCTFLPGYASVNCLGSPRWTRSARSWCWSTKSAIVTHRCVYELQLPGARPVYTWLRGSLCLHMLLAC